MSEQSERPEEEVGADEATPDADVDAGTPEWPTNDEDDTVDEGSPEAPAATGHPAVDEVLRSLDALDARPVDEHVAAFEEAHEQLRRALSSAGDDTP